MTVKQINESLDFFISNSSKSIPIARCPLCGSYNTKMYVKTNSADKTEYNCKDCDLDFYL